MENENEYEGVELEAPQEETTEELELELEEEIPEEDDSIQISKSELSRLKRKAIAYDTAKKSTDKPKEVEKESKQDREERFERLELRADGYSKDEIDEIMSLGGTRVLDTKIVQNAIKYMRAEKKSKDVNEPLSSKSPVYKKFTQDDLSKMSASEMEKILKD